MLNKMVSFLRKEEGVSATEYALIIVFVALIMVVGAKLLGSDLSALFTSVGADV
ncbi:Flp family type IVb pilin [Nevskia soli]|uniref:Flp family type IVb pilin n=1 Tax=Nevskia soli TaxID=418856 RepID=UPI000A0647B9|nr:Flp family type IVb pilin [Nevskia soli]